MAALDGLPEQLRARLAAAAREDDLDALIAEARDEARAQVKALLRDAYADALLAQARPPEREVRKPKAQPERAEPARRAGHGWWVYCVLPGERDLPAGLGGVAEEAPRLVAAAGLSALVSRVPLDQFGEESLRENLNDLAWLEQTVRSHEAVLDALLPGGALVPMRVCTIYRDEAQVEAMLEERSGLFQDALARLAGKTEWGVKVVAQRARLEEHARSQSDEARALAEAAGGGTEGGAYLARKKLAALVRTEADRMLDAIVRETHARLEEWASGSVVLPAQNRDLAGYSGEMVFNGAYLVEDERVDAFARLLDELSSQYAELGLGFDLTGPWPAYNFADGGATREVRP